MQNEGEKAAAGATKMPAATTINLATLVATSMMGEAGGLGPFPNHARCSSPFPVMDTVLDGELQSSKGLAISAGDRGPVR